MYNLSIIIVCPREAAKKVFFLVARPLRPYHPLELSGHTILEYFFSGASKKGLFSLWIYFLRTWYGYKIKFLLIHGFSIWW